MYLIKSIYLNRNTNCIVTEKGIRTAKIKNSKAIELKPFNSFWGDTQINIGEFADFTKMKKIDDREIFLSYANEYEIKNLEDGYKEIIFNVNEYKTNEIKGYIIFAENEEKLSTDGTILYGRYPTDIVVLLEEGQFIKIDEKQMTVLNNNLMLKL